MIRCSAITKRIFNFSKQDGSKYDASKCFEITFMRAICCLTKPRKASKLHKNEFLVFPNVKQNQTKH